IFQRRTPVTQDASTGPSAQPQDDISTNVVCDTLSPADAETERVLIEEDQAGSNPGQSHVVHVGPNPEPMHEDFVATAYPQVHESLKLTMDEHKKKLKDKTTQAISSRVYTLENHDLYSKIDKYVNEVVKEVVHNAHQDPIRERFRDLSEFKMKEILRDRMLESGSYKSYSEHTTLYEALEVSMDRKNKDEFNKEMAKSRERRRDDQDPPPTSLKDSDQSKKKSASKQKSASPSKQLVDDVPLPDDVHLLYSEVIDAAHLPKIKTRPDWLKPLPEEEAPETPKPDWIGKSKLIKSDLEGPAYKLVKPFHKNSVSLQFQMEECHLLLTDQIDLLNLEGNRVVHNISKPLPLGGPPGQVTIQTQYFFNKDTEYLVTGEKERRNALSISKLKAAYHPDFELEELVSSLWIENECDYDISAVCGILHWWFKRKEFYITRHSAPSNRSAVRSHMKILIVFSLKTFTRYGYTYLREIVLRRADYKEYKISKADFKNLHPNDFEDLYLLHLQGKLNHLSEANKVHLFNAVNLWIRNIVIRQLVEDLQLGIESYQTKLNLTQPRWDATDFLFKEDYTIAQDKANFQEPRKLC
nr:hypothetical protein [Tanacetum cinerariifolium]